MKTIELESKIQKAQDAYYNGEALYSDEEYDLMMDQLKAENPDSPLISKIGKDGSSLFPKRKHWMMMGSQQKAANEGQFHKWWVKTKPNQCLAQPKLDGLSLSLQYNEGTFVAAVTRGDGEYGDDVSENVKKIGIPLQLPTPYTGAIRGEILVLHADYKKYFSDKKNCRGAAVGALKSPDGDNAQFLSFIAYDITGDYKTEKDKIKAIIDFGIPAVPYIVADSEAQVVEYRNKIMSSRDLLDFDVDGVVVKKMEVDQEDMKRERPEKQIAFKFELEYADTKLIKVEFSQNGKTLTPVAIIEPVELCGTTVKRASLHNMDVLESFIAQGMDEGSIVRVEKRGEIIPYISKIIKS